MSALEIAILLPIVAYILWIPFSIVRERRQRAIQEEEWRGFAARAAALGWEWQTRLGVAMYPDGLAPAYEIAQPKWCIQGAREALPWLVEQTFTVRGAPGHRNQTSFRGLLAAPATFGLHVMSTTLLESIERAARLSGGRPALDRQARDRRTQTPLPAEVVAGITFGDASRRIAAPSRLEHAGYTVFASDGVDGRVSAILELIAPVFARWWAEGTNGEFDLIVLGGVVEIDVTSVLQDFDTIERLVRLGLSVLEIVDTG